eukprot:evm.model.scf_2120EXC.2 EVM.evm.TU.scf_2120EXC.2   scf_2120EXC:6457-10011(-)
MAHPMRVAKVAKQIEREMGTVFVRDKVVLDALRPKFYAIGEDPIASIVDVDVSGDLQVAKVYLSLYNVDDDDVQATWNRLSKLQPYLRKVLGDRLNLKHTPEVRLIYDKDFHSMHRALDLLDSLREEERNAGDASGEAGTSQPPIRELRRGPSDVGAHNDQGAGSGMHSDWEEEDLDDVPDEFVGARGRGGSMTHAFSDLFGKVPARRSPRVKSRRRRNG